jgi:hypothetical protein
VTGLWMLLAQVKAPAPVPSRALQGIRAEGGGIIMISIPHVLTINDMGAFSRGVPAVDWM